MVNNVLTHEDYVVFQAKGTWYSGIRSVYIDHQVISTPFRVQKLDAGYATRIESNCVCFSHESYPDLVT